MRKPILLLVATISLLVVIFMLLHYVNATYPQVGHDYRYFISRLIDTHLHYKVNGLAIQWYTPSFGGGIPAYPNPQHIQFALPQLLTWFTDPWVATLASIALYLSQGFIAALYFFRYLLNFSSLASILGAVFLVANGFYFQHMAVGHVTFQPFPILAVLVLVLLHPKLPIWLAGVLISFIFTMLIHSGAFYLIVIFLFSLAVSLPLVYFIQPELISLKRLWKIALWGGALTLLMSGSKLLAVNSFLQAFPRTVSDHYPVGVFSALLGVAAQLAGSMTILPFLTSIGKSAMVLVVRLGQWTGSPYSFWELDISVSPVVWLLFLGFIGAWFVRPRRLSIMRISKNQLITSGVLLFALYLLFEYILARGIFYPHLHELPFFRSLRVNARSTAALIFPLAVLGAWVFNQWMKNLCTPSRQWSAFLVLNGLALASIEGMYLLPMSVQVRNFELPSALTAYYIIQQTNESFPIEQISLDMNEWEVFQGRSSTLRNQETFLEAVYHPTLQAGSVYLEQDGFFNMNHPAGFVYPQENHSAPFQRIPVSDRSQLDDFVNRRQPAWNLPIQQRVVNWVSGLTFLAAASASGGYVFRKTSAIRQERQQSPLDSTTNE